jgi:hypothetical protein
MSHIYEKDGISYPSVTTVLHILGDQRLIKWANIMGFKHKNTTDILNESAVFGTLVHKALEYYVNGKEWKSHVTSIVVPRIEEILKRFEDKYPSYTYKTIMTEVSMVNSDLKFGGTADWIIEKDGKTILCDFKTSKSVYPYMLLQLAAYSKLLELERNIRVNEAHLIRVNELYCRSTTFTREELDYAYNAFEHLLAFYILYGDKLNGISKDDEPNEKIRVEPL